MDAGRFDALTRALADVGSRRHALATALGGAIGVLGFLDREVTEAQVTLKKCKKIKDKAKRKKCVKKAKKHAAQHTATIAPPESPPPPPPRPPVSAYECSGPGTHSSADDGSKRYAQTFTPSQSGSLRRIEFGVNKCCGAAGDYLVQLLRVDADGTPRSGIRRSDVITSVTIPDGLVPNGDSTLVAEFSGPDLTGGTKVAAAISRTLTNPGTEGSVSLVQLRGEPWEDSPPDLCPGGEAFSSIGTDQSFTSYPNSDLVVSVVLQV
jgi:hypothetical protein